VDAALHRAVSEELVVHIDFSSWIQEFFKISPDNKHVAYAAEADKRIFVVVDDKDGNQYDGIGQDDPIFSPDSKRVAYAAGKADKCFIVVDVKKDVNVMRLGKALPYLVRIANGWLIRLKWMINGL
jgi:hypothetical protein